jgi:hypothetical protein
MMHKSIRVLLIAFVTVLLCGLAAAQEQKKTDGKPAETKAATPDKPVNWYRVDVAIHELEDGKRVNTRNYTLVTADDGRRVESKTGSRVPVATGKYEGPATQENARVTTQFQYLDVGMNILCSVWQRNGQLYLSTRLDWSSIAPERGLDGQPVIRQLFVTGDAVITALGKPILISSTDDSVSRRRYQVEATVTKQ